MLKNHQRISDALIDKMRSWRHSGFSVHSDVSIPHDNGIRNAIISNFNPVKLRNDIGMLWENFLFVERMKKRGYVSIPANIYFWRTWNQKEIDLIEEREGKLFAYEFTWQSRKKRVPREFLQTYKDTEYSVITHTNYLDFIT